VLVADHGESFAEHDTLQHGRSLSREELNVPLIIRFPEARFAGHRVRERVSLVDLFPTILSQAGVAADLRYPLPGLDLAAVASEPMRHSSRVIHAEVSHSETNKLDLVAVIDEDGYKRTLDMSVAPGEFAARRTVGLWDTNADPGEKADLTESLPVRAAYDEQLIARWLVEQSNWRGASMSYRRPVVGMTDELRDSLRALGYVD
jgi:arylsulfatase A-like enzyme